MCAPVVYRRVDGREAWEDWVSDRRRRGRHPYHATGNFLGLRCRKGALSERGSGVDDRDGRGGWAAPDGGQRNSGAQPFIIREQQVDCQTFSPAVRSCISLYCRRALRSHPDRSGMRLCAFTRICFRHWQPSVLCPTSELAMCLGMGVQTLDALQTSAKRDFN